MKIHLQALLGSLALSVPVAAQITYIDADTNTNTTLADGTAYMPSLSISGTDNEWALRAFANGGTILSSHDEASSNEDAPMLRTTITGLIPTLSYYVYSYHWSTTQSWRGRALPATSQPAPQIPGYNTVHFATSSFSPMQPLAVGCPVGANQTSLGLTFDAAGFETSGHFTTPVLMQEGNRWLYEAWLGVHQADQNGEIHVYIDDLEGPQSSFNRTWYDGVGYELAPLSYGSGCGAPQPTIGFSGAPIANTQFTTLLDNAPAGEIAVTILGFSNASWNGIPLPLDLGLVGFTAGCPLNVSPDFLDVTLTDAAGQAAFPITITQGVPATVYWQWAVLTPSATLVTSLLETHFHR